MEKNIFAKIRDGESEASIVLKNEFVTAFKDIDPSAPHHIIIIPNKEISTVNDIKNEDVIIVWGIYFWQHVI